MLLLACREIGLADMRMTDGPMCDFLLGDEIMATMKRDSRVTLIYWIDPNWGQRWVAPGKPDEMLKSGKQ